VTSFLFVTDKENIKEDNKNPYNNVTLSQAQEWRKKELLGKLHNIIVHIFASTIRLGHFLNYS
jgi:hypothetical protein